VSYSIDVDLAAQDAIAALPVDALLALAEVISCSRLRRGTSAVR
jgi:hypothetical protein